MATESPAPPAAVAASAEPEDVEVKTEGATDSSSALSADDLKAMKDVVDRLSNHRDENGHDVAGLFQRMLNKRLIPDYFEVIKEPIAFSTIRAKVLKKQYTSFSEFIRDVALISHNAQVYNRPSAPVYQDAIALRELFKQELKKLVDDKIITPEEAELPDLGELPPVEDSPPPEAEEEEEEEEDEDEEEEEDESDEERGKKRGKGRSRPSTSKREDGAKDDGDLHKKRGRPPKVHTPMEARIHNVLKGLRKFKHPSGDLKIVSFEKLPDKTLMPEYYQEIRNPMALDLIKRKAKRKKYQSVDAVMKDVELMFENAKEYNREDSQVYKDAVDLQKEARLLAEQEKKKPDSEYADEDGRIPLSEILHNGEIWKVGDWVHIQNPNDVTKPIVAQIYRTWQDPEGQKWINACWYYRPEQTVHRYEKHFLENEVLKTGQYRDHQIDEVVDRCFVMFVTRYPKGRPRGFPRDKEVYVCEARYNEEKFKINKIKTWASCVPDEVREKDYEMDLFDVPRKMKKVPSPIKHLLREDAKEDDELPKPTWGASNAPPIVGAVHKRPREANESPPPEPTPSPPPQPPPETLRRSVTTERSMSYGNVGDVVGGPSAVSHAPPTPIAAQVQQHQQHPPQHQQPLQQQPSPAAYGQQFANPRPSASPAPLQHQNPYAPPASTRHGSTPLTPHFQPAPYSPYAASPAVPHTAPHASSYDQYRASVSSQARNPVSNAAPAAPMATNAYIPPRAAEVYHLADTANSSIPYDIRQQFHRDEHDRVLFFTAPPLDYAPLPQSTQPLGHSISYLAKDTRERADLEKKRQARREQKAAEQALELKRKREEEQQLEAAIKKLKLKALQTLTGQLDAGAAAIYQELYGSDWEAVKKAEEERLVRVQREEAEKAALMELHEQEAIRRQFVSLS